MNATWKQPEATTSVAVPSVAVPSVAGARLRDRLQYQRLLGIALWLLFAGVLLWIGAV